MIHARISRERAVPIWAAIGAPALGVPLMVALLALTAPVESTPASVRDTVPSADRVEALHFEQALETATDCAQPSLHRG